MLPHSDYYDVHADEFVADTLTVDMSELYEPFLTLVPPGGRILDPAAGPVGTRGHSWRRDTMRSLWTRRRRWRRSSMGSGHARRARMIQALKPAAPWFMSFKNGNAEAVRKGRFFNDYDEESLR